MAKKPGNVSGWKDSRRYWLWRYRKKYSLPRPSFGLNTIVYDPGVKEVDGLSVLKELLNDIEECDFLVFTCSLTENNIHMFHSEAIERCKDGVKIINVARSAD